MFIDTEAYIAYPVEETDVVVGFWQWCYWSLRIGNVLNNLSVNVLLFY
jgi:hypothetical protein